MDLSALSQTAAGRKTDAHHLERLQTAAKGFEESFLATLLKQAEPREDPEGDDLLGDSPATRQFQQMLHEGFAQHAAGSLGIADAVVRELALKAGLKPDAGTRP